MQKDLLIRTKIITFAHYIYLGNQMQLYPLKFQPLPKERIWGGTRLNQIANHQSANSHIGETWDVSALEDNDSEVVNGFLAENTLSELLEVYMSDLVGDKTYCKHGNRFPLLVKLLDATDRLSVQVHPNDEMAQANGEPNGKTEMWYVLEADEDAEVILGFNKEVTKEELEERMQNQTFSEVLNYQKVAKGDVVFIPAGTVHAIGKGCMMLEIQQASDTTYRLYDYDRLQKNGQPRQLHTKQAFEAIDYKNWEHTITHTHGIEEIEDVIDCDYFTCNLLHFKNPKEYDISDIDSMVLLSVVEGSVEITYEEGKITLERGETTLIPAAVETLTILPEGEAKLLETYIK